MTDRFDYEGWLELDEFYEAGADGVIDGDWASDVAMDQADEMFDEGSELIEQSGELMEWADPYGFPEWEHSGSFL